MSEQHSLGIQKSLELVNRLQETIGEFVKRETKLTRAMGLITYTFEKHRDELLERGNARLEDQIERTDVEHKVAIEHLKARVDKRQQWIEQILSGLCVRASTGRRQYQDRIQWPP